MKGVIQAYALFVLLMGVALGFMLYIRIDSIQYMSRMVLNQSLHETMVELDALSMAERIEGVNVLIAKNIKLRDYDQSINLIEVMGFHPEPLALRIKLIVQVLGVNWEFDETMIEVES